MAASRQWRHGRRAEELAGVAGLGDSVHHLTWEDHGEREGMTVNATRALVRASKHRRWRSSSDSGSAMTARSYTQ